MKNPLSVMLVLLMGLPTGALGQAEKEEASLLDLVESYEASEKDLADLERRLKESLPASELRRLEERIRQVRSEQDRLAEVLEKRMGPPPPAIRPEKSISLEEEVKSRERRHESVLEKDIERRLP